MTTLRYILVATCLISLHQAYGFRALTPQPNKALEGNQKSFAVRTHVELYTMVRVEASGEVHLDRWLLAYEYKGDSTRGLWRILPDDDQHAVTLLSIQQPGQEPEIWLKEDDSDEVEEVVGIDRRRAFGPSDWNIEDIYDDDKNPWMHRRLGNASIRGQDAIVIESRYSDPELKANSRYDKRRVYLGTIDNRFLQADYFDPAGDLIKTVNAAHHVNFGSKEAPRIRARRLEILDHEDGSITIMIQTDANFEIELDSTFFTVNSLKDWSTDKDKKVLNMLKKSS